MKSEEDVGTCSEVDRLKQVYQEYEVRGFGRSKWSLANRGNQMAWDECHKKIQCHLQENGFLPLEGRRILDVGCGTGERLMDFVELGAQPANLSGVDLIPERIHAARQRDGRITFLTANAEALPFSDDTFDLVTVFTVFTSILDRRMAVNVSREISRVLIRGGAVLWYDFRMGNPLNRHVRGLSRRQIQDLFPGFDLSLKPITLLPPLARRLGALTGLLYRPLDSLPFLRSHYLGMLLKP